MECSIEIKKCPKDCTKMCKESAKGACSKGSSANKTCNYASTKIYIYKALAFPAIKHGYNIFYNLIIVLNFVLRLASLGGFTKASNILSTEL